MLRRHIEGRERRWHNRDTNRHPRPFEWGIEHLDLGNGSEPKTALDRYVKEAIADSDRYFTPEPTSQYEFDGYNLSFPSPVETPYEVNNVVRARFFDAGGPLAVIVLPQWNAQPGSHLGLCRILQRFGVSALRMSLPYHDDRRPDHLERAEYLIGPNIGQTIASNRQAVLEVRRAADWLEARGHTRLGVLGTSIGSCIGFLAMAHDPRLEYNAFIHVSSMFSDVVWKGLSTSHFRETLESAVSLEELRRFWAPISPAPFMPRIEGSRRPMLFLAGKYDLTFPFDLTQQAFSEMERCDIRHERLILPCGHYTMAMAPFREVVGFSVVKFFRRYRN
jgi:hypothetical protein